MFRRLVLAIAALVFFALPASAVRADEGMWTFDSFPSAKVEKAYGFRPSAAFLEKTRLASVRLAFGCSGSFVSPHGLVMTNHHCAQDCITELSVGGKDYNANPFIAKSQTEELRCPAMEINQLVSIADVTARVKGATAGRDAMQANVARRAEFASITGACAKTVRCDVVTLYNGGRYALYTYKPYRDVRLVFAPEFGIAFFGGDPDNFNFPRYDLDVTFLRVYDNGVPLDTPAYFGWNAAGPKDGDLTFVSGNPGRTERLQTVSELESVRDVAQPFSLRYNQELRGLLLRYSDESVEHKQQALDALFGLENGVKVNLGRQEALLDPTFMAQKRAEEKSFRNAVNADPTKRAAFGSAFTSIERAERVNRDLYVRHRMIEDGLGFRSTLLTIAKTLVRGAAERAKPDTKRLPEFTEARLRTLEVRLFSPAPIAPEYERLTLGWSLLKLREILGANDPFVRRTLGARSPEEIAADISTSTLIDPAVRRALWQGGPAAIAASTDPAIVFYRTIDAEARAVGKTYEDRVIAPLRTADEAIGEAQFALRGTSTYPDATFSARLSYGAVKGYRENGHAVAPITNVAGLYDRATGRDPFKLPDSWLAARSALAPSTPMNFVTTNDIIGGNSGSPVIDKNANIVGLVFDGNIQSLGGDFGYDGRVNRGVSVHSAALTAAITKVYHADALATELGIANQPR